MIILISYNLLIILDAITIVIKMFSHSSVEVAANYDKIHILNVFYFSYFKLLLIHFKTWRQVTTGEGNILVQSINICSQGSVINALVFNLCIRQVISDSFKMGLIFESLQLEIYLHNYKLTTKAL